MGAVSVFLFHSIVPVSFFIIKVAMNASKKLKGTAIGKILKGKTPKFPITNHMKTNPTNQDKNAV